MSLIVPLPWSCPWKMAPLATLPVSYLAVEDLPLIGPSLVGWHSRNHPYCVLFMHEPRMDDPTRYEFRLWMRCAARPEWRMLTITQQALIC